MTDKRPPLPQTSLYSPFFKTGVCNPSRFKVVEDQPESRKLLSILDDIQKIVARNSLEQSTRKLLEQHFTRIITDQIKASYSSDDVFQLIMEEMKGLDPSDDGLEDTVDDDLDDTEIEQKFDSCLPASKDLG